MPKMISADIVYKIIGDLALGYDTKQIMAKYNVSQSFVSKVKTGKRTPNVYIPEQIKIENKIAFYESDIDRLEQFFEEAPVSFENNSLNSLDALIAQKISELKVLLATRKVLRNDNSRK